MFSARSFALPSSSHASARSSARSRPRGRVPLIGSALTMAGRVRPARNGSGEADAIARGRPSSRAAAEVQVGREQRRVAGPEAPVERPRVAAERRLQPPRQVGLVDLAAGDRVADRPRRRPRTSGRSRFERTAGRRRSGDVGLGTSGRRPTPTRRAARGRRRGAARAGRGRRRRRDRRARPARSAVPGDRPVVQAEPQRRQPLVVPGERRPRLEREPEVIRRGSRRARPGTAGRLRSGGSAVALDGESPSSRRAARTGRGRRPAPRGRRPGRRIRNVQRERRPGRALSSRARPGRSRNASATSIGASAVDLRAAARSRLDEGTAIEALSGGSKAVDHRGR